VRYIAESRLGIAFARNRGAEEARYPYLWFRQLDLAHFDGLIWPTPCN